MANDWANEQLYFLYLFLKPFTSSSRCIICLYVALKLGVSANLIGYIGSPGIFFMQFVWLAVTSSL